MEIWKNSTNLIILSFHFMRHPQQISIGMEKVEKLTHWAGLPLTASLLEMPLKTFAEPLGEKNMVTIKLMFSSFIQKLWWPLVPILSAFLIYSWPTYHFLFRSDNIKTLTRFRRHFENFHHFVNFHVPILIVIVNYTPLLRPDNIDHLKFFSIHHFIPPPQLQHTKFL